MKKRARHEIVLSFCNHYKKKKSFSKLLLETVLVPVHKSGTKYDPSNYRGISLLNVLYKIFSIIINDRLVK